MMVAAVFPQDNQIYRAKITNIKMPDIEVLYVDYGNSAMVKWEQVFRLADKFAKTPAQVRNMCVY